MKPFYVLIVVFVLTNCKDVSGDRVVLNEKSIDDTFAIAAVEVSKDLLVLNQLEGKWYYNNEPFNGFSVKYYSNLVLRERLGFYKGKREGVARRWSENGVLRSESYYHENRLVDVYKSWWENGEQAEESNYINGVKQGIEKKWFPSGQLAKLRKLVDGKEEGIQQAWLHNGKLYVNYEAKNGRIFGMRRANSCYKLEDEVIIRN